MLNISIQIYDDEECNNILELIITHKKRIMTSSPLSVLINVRKLY